MQMTLPNIDVKQVASTLPVVVPAVHDVAVIVYPQFTVTDTPLRLHPVNCALPLAVSTIPTKSDGSVPPTSVLLQLRLVPVELSVVPPLVAVNDVAPVLCHVTALAVDDSTPSADDSAVTSRARRMILVMVLSSYAVRVMDGPV
jgi:hypothetical protein